MNQIEALPEGLGRLHKLQDLHLDVNRLNTLPIDLAELTQLRNLTLSNNPGLVVPEEIEDLLCMSGAKSVWRVDEGLNLFWTLVHIIFSTEASIVDELI